MSNAARGEHVVTFYDRDSELCQSVARFAAEGLQRGEHVVLMTTLEHARDIRSMMSAAYPDVDHAAATAAGQLVFEDAGAIARACLHDGTVDRQRFTAVVSDILARVKPPMRVFGEVVSLMAGSGELEAAMDAEALGHQLAHQAGVNVLCAYDLRPITEHAARERIAQLHDRAMVPASMRETPVVLLADDFEDARELYRDYLELKGYRVVTACDGRDAIAVAHTHRPAAILLDVRMPNMSGLEAMQVLKQDPAFAGVPILALTAHALPQERDMFLAKGFDAVLAKPCLPDHLARTLDALLDGSPRSFRY